MRAAYLGKALTKETFGTSACASWVRGGEPHVPVEVEIGIGKSTFLVELALAFPLKRFIGLDTSGPWADQAAASREQRNISNLAYAQIEGLIFLRHFVDSGTLDALHIYFPSPYPRERRLITEEFASEASRALCPGGMLRLATDSIDYFSVALGVLCSPSWHEVPWTPPARYQSKHGRVGTPAERDHGVPYLLAVCT